MSISELWDRASHPPWRDRSFWLIQGMVLVLAGLHLMGDLYISSVENIFPTSVPVELLLIPIGYAAIRHGLSGSVATSIWATVAWLPDLALPNEQGHPINDITELSLIVAAAIFVGIRVEKESVERTKALQAKKKVLEAETRYRELFEANSAPIILINSDRIIVEANPEATRMFGNNIVGRDTSEVFDIDINSVAYNKQTVSIRAGEANGNYFNFRLLVSEITSIDPNVSSERQLVFQDVTEEQRERAFAAMLINTQEEERRRIAREIHDEPLQALIQLSRKAELEVEKSVSSDSGETFLKLRKVILEIVAQLRNVIKGLRPVGLDQLGLIAALRALVSDLEDGHDTRIDLKTKGIEERLSDAVELGVFRIIQEAINNSLRHSRARKIDVQLEFSDSCVKVQVVDDGIGFAIEKVDSLGNVHMGLMGIYERASLLGGMVEIISSPDDGTRVTASIPIV